MQQKDEPDGGSGFASLKDGSTDSAAIESYYDDWAASYDETLKDWDYRAPNDAADILRPHLRAGDRLLDVGCGTGLFAEVLSHRLACRCDGIDISAASLEVAEQRNVYDDLRRHDLQRTPLPFADDTFDAAACIGVLTYIAEPGVLLADLCRVVRGGGHLLFTQRDDRWAENDFDALVERFAAERLWTPLAVTEPKPYLPRNEDFSDSIRVVHVLCRVV